MNGVYLWDFIKSLPWCCWNTGRFRKNAFSASLLTTKTYARIDDYREASPQTKVALSLREKIAELHQTSTET